MMCSHSMIIFSFQRMNIRIQLAQRSFAYCDSCCSVCPFPYSELVLDNRTRLILLKMINRGVMKEVHGCISTGKEVRVQLPVSDILPLPLNTA